MSHLDVLTDALEPSDIEEGNSKAFGKMNILVPRAKRSLLHTLDSLLAKETSETRLECSSTRIFVMSTCMIDCCSVLKFSHGVNDQPKTPIEILQSFFIRTFLSACNSYFLAVQVLSMQRETSVFINVG